MEDNSFEKFPGETVPTESEIRAKEWEDAMSEGVPEFAGDVPPLDVVDPTADTTAEEAPEDLDNPDLSDASAIINYGLNAAAREYGVETVVQKIKSLDISNSVNPIKDLFLQLGVDTPPEVEELHLEREAIRAKETDFYNNNPNAPATRRPSPEGAFKAIKDMKELITEVEGADPRYDELRANAKAAGKGYFEYAVGSAVQRDLTDLFNILGSQPPVKGENALGSDLEGNPGISELDSGAISSTESGAS